MRRRHFVLGGVSLAALAGCAPPAPQYQDPLADLTSVPIRDVPMDVPVSAGPTQAVTFGSNVERWLRYADEANRSPGSWAGSAGGPAEADPQTIVNQAVAILRRKYPNLQMVQDLEHAAREHIATTFVLDIRSAGAALPGSETTCDLEIVAFDAEQRPISRLVAHGTSTSSVTPNALEAPEKALAELNAKAESLLS